MKLIHNLKLFDIHLVCLFLLFSLTIFVEFKREKKNKLKMVKKKMMTSQRVKTALMETIRPKANTVYVENRNPRNLEMMKIAYRPSGYHLEAPGRCFWHR